MVTALSILVAGGLGGPEPLLDSLRHKARVAIVFGAPDSARVKTQRKSLDHPGAKARDIVVLTGTEALRRRFDLGGRGFAFVLVGKDGHTALASRAPVSRKRLYALIDAMPMRREEMRRRGG